jgi:UrcA family protein
MKAQIRIAAATLVLVTGVAFGTSHAAAPAAPSVAVSLAGLNLEKAADAKVLYKRLQKASFQVCQKVIGTNMTTEVGKCASDLLDLAVWQVNRPALSALHGREALELTARR